MTTAGSFPAAVDRDSRTPTSAGRASPRRPARRASPHDWLDERRVAVADGLRRLAAAARAGVIAGGSIEDSGPAHRV